ncbi:MAG: hypothetical protein ACTSWD_04925 [Candidatus Heimdallarchaeota archaeon]
MEYEEEITKIGKNHVVVKKFLFEKDGTKVEIREKREEYGQTKIDELKQNSQADFDKWDKLSAEEIGINKAKAQVKLDRANGLQLEMDKVLEAEEPILEEPIEKI